MDAEEAIRKIQNLIDQIESLRRLHTKAPEFIQWKLSALLHLECVFGKDSSHASEFKKIYYTFYHQGLQEAQSLLEYMIRDIREHGLPGQPEEGANPDQDPALESPQEASEEPIEHKTAILNYRAAIIGAILLLAGICFTPPVQTMLSKLFGTYTNTTAQYGLKKFSCLCR